MVIHATEIQFSNKKKPLLYEITVDESQKYYAKWRKLDINKYTLSDSICLLSRMASSHCNRKQGQILSVVGEWGDWSQKSRNFRVAEIFFIF